MLRGTTVESYYAGACVYRGDGSLDYILHPEGVVRATGQGLSHECFLKDHLGNTRVVFGSNGAVLQATDYYAFGLEHTPLAISNTNRYLYNGKELQDETFAGGVRLGWYDYGFRFYDPAIARFTTVDPRAEKYNEWSPYTYVLNNPILNIDPRGDTVRVYTETSGVGHAWLSVGDGENMTVYTYGRYAGTDEKSTGINTLSDGPGVLVKLKGEDAKAYNDKKAETTGSEVFQVLDVKDEDVADVMDNAFNSSDVMPSKGEYKDDPRARVIDKYSITDNNCATKTSGAINDAGSQALKPEQVSPLYKTSQKPVAPVSLQNILKIKSYTQSEIVKQQK